jgi:hypothetical protein
VRKTDVVGRTYELFSRPNTKDRHERRAELCACVEDRSGIDDARPGIYLGEKIAGYNIA